jgi:hypothetical protein
MKGRLASWIQRVTPARIGLLNHKQFNGSAAATWASKTDAPVFSAVPGKYERANWHLDRKRISLDDDQSSRRKVWLKPEQCVG